ncbi:MAG: enhanced intracellular survival protein Eis [Actinomycetota bacterium]
MTEIRRLRADEFDEAFSLGRRAFPMQPESDRERLRDRFVPEMFTGVFDDGRMIGRTIEHRFGHHLGGRVVPAIGIAGVAVDPTIRGRGIGSQMMNWVHEQARGDGIPFASLYPATLPIYRNLGYGDAFHRTAFTARLERLPSKPIGTAVVESYTDSDESAVRDAYDRFASTQAGIVARDDDWWEHRILDLKTTPQRYVVREEGELVGYFFFDFAPAKDDWRQRIDVKDMVALTPSAGSAILAFAALHRSTCSTIHWTGPANEPLQWLQHDHAIELSHGFNAMARVLDVPGAIASRGYFEAVEAEVSLAISDPRIPDNDGPWLISVVKGVGSAEPARSTDGFCTIQAFSSMFTGMLSPADARRVGGLSADDEAVRKLTAIFAGPTPWLSDFY